MDVPPLDGAEVVSLHNLGLFKVVARLLAGASREERARERDRYVRIAGSLLEVPMASTLHRRMVELARMTSLRVLAVESVVSVDGALTAALIVSEFEVPHQRTIARALQRRQRRIDTHPVSVSTSIVHNGERDDTNLRAV